MFVFLLTVIELELFQRLGDRVCSLYDRVDTMVRERIPASFRGRSFCPHLVAFGHKIVPLRQNTEKKGKHRSICYNSS